MKGKQNSIQLAGLRILGGCGVLAVCMFGAADLVGILKTPGYSAKSDAISELVERGAVAKHLVDPLLAAYHTMAIPFAVGLQLAVAGRVRWMGPFLIAVAGVSGVILTLFLPCDPGCEPFVSLSGTLHVFVAIPMGFAILGGLFLMAARFRDDSRWAGFARYSGLSALAGVVLATITVALAETVWVGLLERALTWVYLQWYLVVGAAIANGRGGHGAFSREDFTSD